MRSSDLDNIKFALKNPIDVGIISIGVLVIIFLSVLGPFFFNTLIGGELSGAKRGLSDLFYVLFVLSATGPILLWIVFAGEKIIPKITRKQHIAMDTSIAFKFVGAILSIVFVILFIYFSTSFMLVDSSKISQKTFLITTNEISFDSVESINAVYSNGGNVEIAISYSGNKIEVIAANGANWEKVPYTETQIDFIFFKLKDKISIINVNNVSSYFDDETAIEVVKNRVGKNSNYFDFK